MNQFHEEFRVLYHFDSERVNASDYFGQFLSQFPQPLIYVWITKAALAAGMELALFHRLLGAFCFVAFVAGVAAAARPLGWAAVLGAGAVAAAQIISYEQTSSATPHAFAFPLLAWMLVALISDRPIMGAMLTVLASLLYVPVAPLMGLMATIHIVVLQRAWAGPITRKWRGLMVLAVCGLVTLFLVYNQLVPLEGYGVPISPGERLGEFPENGPLGRYNRSVFEPLDYIVSISLGQFSSKLPPISVLLLFLLVGTIAAIGLNALKTRPRIFYPTLVFVASAGVMFALVFLLRPYVSYRFALYPLYTLLPLLVVSGVQFFSEKCFKGPASGVGTTIALLALLGTIGNVRFHEDIGRIEVNDSDKRVLEFIKSLPKDSLVAAWPGQDLASMVPYLAEKPLFVDFKAHYPSYEGHVLEVRKRMYDLIAAFFTNDPDELKGFVCKWGVDYILLDSLAMQASGLGLSYFAPFDEKISAFQESREGQQLELAEPPESGILFQDGRHIVVDMTYYAPPGSCE